MTAKGGVSSDVDQAKKNHTDEYQQHKQKDCHREPHMRTCFGVKILELCQKAEKKSEHAKSE